MALPNFTTECSIDLSFITKYLNPDGTVNIANINTDYLSFREVEKGLYLIKYNKHLLKNYEYNTLKGLLRSVLFTKDGIVAFSPPKSLSEEHIKCFDVDVKIQQNTKKDTVANSCKVMNCFKIEDFIEGIMVNWFYYDNKWRMSTKSVLDGNCKFYDDKQKTFRDLFFEAFEMLGLNEEHFHKEYCYSFVLQHPDYRIVTPFMKPNLYLIDIFECAAYWQVIKKNKDSECFRELLNRVSVPYIHNRINEDNSNIWKNIKNNMINQNYSYQTVGFQISFGFMRHKIINPVYEKIKKLRGNNNKLQFQYYSLRHNGEVAEFLKHYPEYKSKFNEYRNDIHEFTTSLWKNYMMCYVTKVNLLEYCNYQFRPHIKALHEIYRDRCHSNSISMKLNVPLLYSSPGITRHVVIEYVNRLPPARLMYIMNYHHRENSVDIINKELTIY
uniref:T4 RNA ligase 1-like N-terminal domain-containing protein n=1 Tax=viral metagenome TaxID=1070528 RepID=A0A6C0KI23_9ZZZZ